MKIKKSSKSKKREIKDYDFLDTTHFIDTSQSLKFEDLGLTLPPTPPTQVVSIRLPSELLNAIRVISSEKDIPYQALIKIFLADSVKKIKKSA